ncbi:MAG: hypothetical protein NVS4B6_12530 [Mycobacterium sp.]
MTVVPRSAIAPPLRVALVLAETERGKVASTDEISLAVWGHLADTNTVAVHVRRPPICA